MAIRTFQTAYDFSAVDAMRDKTHPLAEFIPVFIMSKPLATHTKRDYQRYLERYDAFTGGRSLEDALTVERASQFIAEELSPRGPYTAQNGCMALKSFSSWIAKQHYLKVEGGTALKALEAPRVPKSRRTAFTDTQIESIFRAVAAWPARHRARATAVLHVLLATGLRRNEARQIAARDLEIDIARGRGFVRVRAETSKGNKDRVSRLNPMAIAALDDYLNAPLELSHRPTYSGPRNVPEPVFLTEQGKGFTEYGWSTFCDRLWSQIEADTGIKGTSHLLRHTWATNYNRFMNETGNNVYDLKREGGWSNLAIPLTYTHDRPEAELLEMKTPAEALWTRRQKAS